MEGASAAISSLRDRLERDPPHTDIRVLQFGRTADRRRRFASWRLGYAYSADPAAIDRIELARGDGAVDAFGRWSGSLSVVGASR